MTLSPKLKKGLKIAGIAFVVLLGTAIALPFFFKDKIVAKIKTAINEELLAKVDFKDVDISLLRHFPRLSVRLEGLDVTGTGTFEGTKLLHTEGLDLALDFWSVWNGGQPYEVNSVYLDRPLVNILVLSDGQANYNITKPSEPSEPSTFKLTLDKYVVSQGTFIYDDRTLGFYTALKGFEHKGSGEMTADVYDLDTRSDVDSLTLSYGGITYLSNAKTHLDMILNANMKDMRFTLKETAATINALALNMAGFVQVNETDMPMDLTFSAPSNDFKDLLSIIPAAYTKDFEAVKATGTFKLAGFVKGVYNGDKAQYPSFEIGTTINNATFQYPSLPMGVSDINGQLVVALPNSNFDAFKVDVPNFHFKLGQNPFDLIFHLRTPVSDPDVDLTANGTLNLADLPKALPLEDFQGLSGLIAANVKVRTLMSYIDKKYYDKIDMNGALKVDNMAVQMAGYPSVFIQQMALNFTPNKVDLGNFNAKIGKSDLVASGSIDNILALFSTNKTMTGTLTFASNVFDANEWLSPTPSVSNTSNVGTMPADPAERPFDRFDFTMNGKIGRLVYDNYDIRNMAAEGHFTPNRFAMNRFETQIGNSDISGKGTLVGVFDWLFDNSTLGGALEINSNLMDLNQFMTPTPAPAAATQPSVATEPFVVPKNLDLTLAAKMNKILYTNMTLTNMVGTLLVKNQEVRILEAATNAVGGRFGMTGAYNTQNPQKPTFKLSLDMKSIDFQESFKTFNTVQKLAPIAEYIKGKFNTTFDMDGELGADLMPNFNTLNLSGFIQTLQGAISGYKPLEEIGNRLNINELKGLDLKDTKNWIEVKNGTIVVKEFDKQIKDIALKIGGSHSLTNEMNYAVRARVPRKRLESNAVGAAVGAGFNNMVAEAQKLGVNIKNSPYVNVLLNLSGSIKQPKIGFKFLADDDKTGLGDAANTAVTNAATQVKDSLLNKANAQLEGAKDQAKKVADKAVDSATTVIKNKVDEAKDKAIDKVKQQAGEKLGTEVGTQIDKTLDKAGLDKKAKEELEKAKERLNKWDPFKKNKPGNQ